jgi:DNA-binding transcriptional MerR regulator
MTSTYTIDQLCTLIDLPKRTVRYYMQLGLVDRPVGETRAAHYTPVHLGQLMQIRKLADAGVSLERIRAVLAGGESPVPERERQPGAIRVHSHVFIAPGVELQIDPQEAGLSPEQLRAFVRTVMTAWENKNEQ